MSGIIIRWSYLKTVILILAILLLLVDSPAALYMPVGNITGLSGNVVVNKPGNEKPVGLRKEDAVFIGDILRTGRKSRVQVTFIDDNFVNVSSESSIMVNQYIFDRERKRRKVIVKLLEGGVRFILYKKYSNSSFAVEAGNASITGNIADFTVKVSPHETEVIVLDGFVNVKNISSMVVGEIRLGINQKTAVKEKNPPSEPEIVTSQQRNAWIEETNVH